MLELYPLVVSHVEQGLNFDDWPICYLPKLLDCSIDTCEIQGRYPTKPGFTLWSSNVHKATFEYRSKWSQDLSSTYISINFNHQYVDKRILTSLLLLSMINVIIDQNIYSSTINKVSISLMVKLRLRPIMNSWVMLSYAFSRDRSLVFCWIPSIGCERPAV